MKTATLILGLLIAALVAKQLWAQTTGDSAVPIDVAVPLSPVAVRAGGAWHLFYELHLTNFRRQDIELTLLETHAGPTDGPLVATYTEQGLSDLLVRPALPPNDTADKRVIGAGLRAVVMLNLVVKDKVLPTTLWHRLLFRMTETDNQQELVIGPIRISPDKPVKLAPPLRMGEWLAANGPSDSSDHRRALIAVNGKARIAQRFAIDWVKFGADGRLWHDEESRNENWYGYGAEIIAVANGTVVATKDGIPENIPLTNRFAVEITMDTIAGNYILVDLGGGRFATFAHLQPGSLRVSVGSKVRRGQVLGLLGNSGNSDAPHLHFQITDGPSGLGSEGLPFIFDSLQVAGTIPSLDGLLGGNPWKPSVPVVRRQEMPLENEVVRFP